MARKIKIVVKRISRVEYLSPARDREYWLSRPPEERIEAVEILRRQFWGDELDKPIQRVVTRRNLRNSKDW